MGLPPPARRYPARMRLNGEEHDGLSERRLRQMRGARIGMIFQDPMTALNPVMRVGDLIAEAVRFITPEVSARTGAASAPSVCSRLVSRAAAGSQRLGQYAARVLRRHAAARDDRDGDRQQSRRC